MRLPRSALSCSLSDATSLTSMRWYHVFRNPAQLNTMLRHSLYHHLFIRLTDNFQRHRSRHTPPTPTFAPQLAHRVSLVQVTTAFVREYVDIYYKTDEDIKADKELNMFWKGLRVPHQSKVRGFLLCLLFRLCVHHSPTELHGLTLIFQSRRFPRYSL